MKKLVLLFTGLLIGLTTVSGKETGSKSELDYHVTFNKRYHHAQPILFVERGIEFIIFPNGDFDFNTSLDYYGYNNHYSGDLYYRNTNSRRRVLSSPGNFSRHYDYRPRGVKIVHDRFGNVRRVGNVFVNYDFYGRVKRIGSVYIKYRWNRLVQVGGLQLIYNRRGKFVGTRGNVNRNWRANWNNNHFGWDNDYYWNNNDDYYYYRKNGKTVKKFKKLKNRKHHKIDKNIEYDD